MLKRVKSVSMLLFLMAASTGSMNAVSAPAIASSNAIEQQTETCKGVVKDAMGETVIGASVVVKGTTNGTITGIDGDFTLSGVSEGSILVISYVGYVTQEVKFNGQPLNVILKEDSQTLEEVVVVGYGVQKKANLTGAVATVNAKALESRPVSSVSAAIAGQMPGVTAIQSSGAPGGQAADITIRGKNSINAASPLVIVDGVPGSMNTIDPNDIETFTVLKDAASAAIYGVQAANGVILITTKQGKKGEKARVTYSGNVSWSSPVAKRELVNAYEYAVLYNEATLNENPNATLMFSPEEIEDYRTGALPSTDWYEAAIKKSAIETMHNVSISGGTEKTTYNASLGYIYQDGLTADNDYSRFNARMNLNSEINKYIKVGINASGYRGVSNDAWNGFVSVYQGVTREKPTNKVYNEDGSYTYSGVDNPVAIQGDKSGFKRNTQQEINLTGHATIQILPELSIKGVYSVRNYTSNQDGFKKHFTYGSGSNAYDSGLREGYDKYYNHNYYTGQVLINFNKSFGKHNISALAGFESYEHIYKYTEATRQGGGSDELPESLNTLDQSSQKNKDGGYEMARLSYFGRIQYDYAGKYLFEANLRSDASSRFPKDNRWGVFPAFSAGWRISEENFWKNTRAGEVVNNLKLRASYGVLGNQNIGVYPYQQTYDLDHNYPLGNPATLVPGTYVSTYRNQDLTWEKTAITNVGLDFGLFNNTLNGSIEYFYKYTSDILAPVEKAGILGQNVSESNVGAVSNKGIEVNLSYNGRIGRDFQFSIAPNFTWVKNAVEELANGATEEINNNRIVGQPIGIIYGYQTEGLFVDQAEIDAAPEQLVGKSDLKPGYIRYKDISGPDGVPDGKVDAEYDRTVLGSTTPKFYYGLNLSASYKGFDFSALFQGLGGYQRQIGSYMAYAFYNGGQIQRWQAENCWTKENPDKWAEYPRIETMNMNHPNLQTSDYWVRNASFLRLKNLQLGYTLPQAWTKKIGIEKLRVYVSGQNLFSFNSFYQGWDPENEIGTGDSPSYYPITAIYSFGFNFKF